MRAAAHRHWLRVSNARRCRRRYPHVGYEPAGLIATDFRVAELRRTERARLAALETTMEAAAVEDRVEALLPYNCEHGAAELVR
jgi:hypothetical protein